MTTPRPKTFPFGYQKISLEVKKAIIKMKGEGFRNKKIQLLLNVSRQTIYRTMMTRKGIVAEKILRSNLLSQTANSYTSVLMDSDNHNAYSLHVSEPKFQTKGKSFFF